MLNSRGGANCCISQTPMQNYVNLFCVHVVNMVIKRYCQQSISRIQRNKTEGDNWYGFSNYCNVLAQLNACVTSSLCSITIFIFSLHQVGHTSTTDGSFHTHKHTRTHLHATAVHTCMKTSWLHRARTHVMLRSKTKNDFNTKERKTILCDTRHILL